MVQYSVYVLLATIMVYYCISVVVTRPQSGHMKTCMIAAMCTFSCMHRKVIIVMHGKSLLVASSVLYTFTVALLSILYYSESPLPASIRQLVMSNSFWLYVCCHMSNSALDHHKQSSGAHASMLYSVLLHQ